MSISCTVKNIYTKIKPHNRLFVFKFQELVLLPIISYAHLIRNVRYMQGKSSAYTEVILHLGFATNFFEEIIPTLKLSIKSKWVFIRPKLI